MQGIRMAGLQHQHALIGDFSLLALAPLVVRQTLLK
jgi:hypothetical protein